MRRWILSVAAGLGGCAAGGVDRADALTWETVALEADARGMLMSMWGAPGDDAWLVGGTLTGTGIALRVTPDGVVREQPLPEATPMLTWVHGRAADDLWLAGLYGTLLHWDGTEWTRVGEPVDEAYWGVHAGPDGTVVAVGGPFRGVGAASRLVRGTREGIADVPLPDEVVAVFDADPTGARSLFKVHHDGARFAVVGASGAALTLGATGDAAWAPSGSDLDLVTVHGEPDDVIAVGGRLTGGLFERDGDGWALSVETPAGASGVHRLGPDRAVVVGEGGFAGVWHRDDATFVEADPRTTDLLHAVWVDPDDGTVWGVGGNWTAADYTGVLLRGVLR